MNIHHLELFHYVAKHEGIAGAVRNIPYGIQQPAVSAQVIQLEIGLGATLFQRRSFEFTPAGVELYDFIHPFFANLESMGEKIRGGVAQTIRIGASGALGDFVNRLAFAEGHFLAIKRERLGLNFGGRVHFGNCRYRETDCKCALT